MLRRRKKKSKLAKKRDNPNSTYWLKKADAAFYAYITARQPRCRVGETGLACAGNLETHHLVGRANRSSRHDPRCGFRLCSKHHKWDILISAHGAPLAFASWLMEHHPDLFSWAASARITVGKPDYRAAYERLVKDEEPF